MIATKLRIRNYGPYRGEHVLELRPTIYSITARDHADPERSNWIGKSWLMSAFRFALYGEHPAEAEDRWITDGETEGSVELSLDGGFRIERSRKKGSSTKLVVERAGSEEKAIQERAQEIISKIVGFSRDDFDASCWVGQKKANAIVVADPAPRTKMIAGWMDLGPLQAAERIEADRLLKLVARDSELAREVERLRSLVDSVGDPAELSKREEDAKTAIREAEARLLVVHAEIETANERNRLSKAKEELDRIVADGRALKAAMTAEGAGGPELSAKREEAEDKARDASTAAIEAKAEVDRLGRLVVGKGFDGVCPVTRGECPAGTEIRNRARKMTEELRSAEEIARKAESDRVAAETERRRIDGLVQARQMNAGRLSTLRERAKVLMAELEGKDDLLSAEPVDAVALKAEAARLSASIGIAKGEIVSIRKELGSIDGWKTAADEAEAERKELSERLRIHREALVVLGRNGAQREIASGYLAEIEVGANDLLGGAGIDLAVKARWGREGGGLATHCQSCGQPFPLSQKVKECAFCGSVRGPKMIEKLELELSRASDGAAEDIAGLAMQLSAAAWLRARRQASWAAVFIDEPFAAADARIGQLLAGRLRSLLGGRFSFRQAFVISHNAGLTESMPGRIEIIREANGVRVEVR